MAKRDAPELGRRMGDAIRTADLRIENSRSVEEFEWKEWELLEGREERGRGFKNLKCPLDFLFFHRP